MYLEGCDSFGIPIVSKGKLVNWTIVDLALADHLLQFRYRLYPDGARLYIRRSDNTTLHEIIIGGPAPYGQVIDHINGDGLDNTRGNLRYATHSQNAQNRPKKEGTSSKYIGVTKGSLSTWSASISDDSKTRHLGAFNDEMKAGRMYDARALRLFGKFAKVNGLLSQEETMRIINGDVPDEFKGPKKIRSLPHKISIVDDLYEVRFVRDGITYTDVCSTRSAAVLRKAELLILANRKARNVPDSLRNARGQAIISVTSRGQSFEVVVDAHTQDDLNNYSWGIDKGGYAKTGKAMGEYLMHRYLWVKHKGPIPDGLSIDHINNNRIDNRLENLRLANQSLQSHNRDIVKSPIDKHRGVTFSWPYFYVCVTGEPRKEAFETLEMAALTVNEIYKKLYGVNARLNQVDLRVRTTCWTRIPRDMITRSFVKSLTRLQDVICVVKVLKMDKEQGGRYDLRGFKKEHIEEAKKQILRYLIEIM